MTPAHAEEPFWTYLDLALFIALAFPCIILGGLIAKLFTLISPALDPAKIWVGMLVFYGLWFGCLYLLLKSRYYRPFWASLGWIYNGRGMLLAAITGPLLAVAVGLMGQLLHTPTVDLPMKKLLEGRLSLALFGVFSVLIGPVTEELAFRGFLMPLLVHSLGPAAGIILTAIPFGLLHGTQYGWHWQYVVLVGFAGAIFGWVRYSTGSTLASATLHSAYNLTFFAAFVVGGSGF
jgi:uncharacterized protein